MLRDLALPEGAFASSQDADTDGVEGLTYTWTAGEVGPEVAPLLEPFEHGRSIIRGELSPDARARLLAVRAERPQPGRDDKAIASWNGLALAALAEAGRRLERPDWIDAARSLADFLLGPLSSDGRLRRSYRAGRASGTGYLDDYANVAHGLYELHVATGELRFLEESRRLALLAIELFADDDRGGFFMTPSDGERLVARTKDLDDSPIPSGNSMLAHVLLRLGRIYGDDELERRAVSVLRLVAPSLARSPSFFAWALCALDLYLSTPREIAIVGQPQDEVARAALAGFEPNTVVAFGPGDDVPLLDGKTAVGRCADGLRLRALRLPGSGHGTGASSSVATSCSKARSKTSRGCAPSTRRRRSSRKPGTPVMPIDTACAVSPSTRSRYASSASTSSTSAPSSPASTARSRNTPGSPMSRASAQ